MKLYGMVFFGLIGISLLAEIPKIVTSEHHIEVASSRNTTPNLVNGPEDRQALAQATGESRQEGTGQPKSTRTQGVDPQSPAGAAQETPAESKTEAAPKVDNTDLMARVIHLETRIEALERIVFATSQLTVYESQRRLKEAEQMLRDRRELFLKGLLAESAWRQDQLQVEILKRELSMAQAASIQKENVFEIEVLQARQRLSDAKLQFERSQTLVNRGFATQTQLERDSRLVTLSQQQLNLAEQKLNAARDLESIKGSNPSDLPPAPIPPTIDKK